MEKSWRGGTVWSLATWFGCGASPFAPGTAGSLGALLPVIALQAAGIANWRWVIAGAVILLVWPGMWAAGEYARASNRKDPGAVVVDEVLGQWVTLLFAPNLGWYSLAAAFVLFRAFDIVKPPPVRQAESLPGGIGIVADDLVAGLFGGLVFSLVGWFNLK